jgi:hypothetical protein
MCVLAPANRFIVVHIKQRLKSRDESVLVFGNKEKTGSNFEISANEYNFFPATAPSQRL